MRNDAGRNALSGVKVSSPVKLNVPEWPSYYGDAKATPLGIIPMGAPGVQVHGMYRRLFQELGRSPADRALKSPIPKAKVDNQVTKNTMMEKSDWSVVAMKRSNARRAKGPAGLGLMAFSSRARASKHASMLGMRDALDTSFGRNQEPRSPLPKLGTAGSARGLFPSLIGEE